MPREREIQNRPLVGKVERIAKLENRIAFSAKIEQGDGTTLRRDRKLKLTERQIKALNEK